MSVNKSWFPKYSDFRGHFNPNGMLPNIRNNLSPSGMVDNGNIQIQRFPKPFIRGPPPFLCRPPFPARMDQANNFSQSQPPFSRPPNQPFMYKPRIPSGPSVRQPYSGNSINQTGQTLTFPSPNGSPLVRQQYSGNSINQTGQTLAFPSPNGSPSVRQQYSGNSLNQTVQTLAFPSPNGSSSVRQPYSGNSINQTGRTLTFPSPNGSPLVRQPYSGNLINQTVQTLAFPSPNGSPSMRQTYSSNLFNQTGQTLAYPSQNGGLSGRQPYAGNLLAQTSPIHKAFKPWDNSSKNKQWDSKIRPAMHSTFHYTPHPQGPLPVNVDARTNGTPTFNPQAQRLRKPWVTNGISEELNKRNELHTIAKETHNEKAWCNFRNQQNKARSLIKGVKPKSKAKVRKFKDEELIKPHPFLCEVCDRAFMKEHQLNDHIKEHIKCNLDGCPFSAHPKVIALHRKMQHDTGYAKAILKLTDLKEIEKWRSERRNRFPTAANIKRRQEENAEKMSRGEVIETKDFGKFKKRKVEHVSHTSTVEQRAMENIRPHRNRRQRFRPRYKKNNREKQKQTKVCFDDDDDDSHIQLPPFKGMQSTINTEQKDLGIMDICDDSKQLQDSQNITDAEERTALRVLSDNKQDVDVHKNTDDDTSYPEVVTTLCNGNVHDSPESVSASNEIINSIVDDSDNDAPIVLPTMKSTDNECIHEVEKKNIGVIKTCHPQEKQHNSDQIQQKPAVTRNNMGYIPSSCRNNLLEKLLAKEISHERNIVFQCVRYVVENDFFGVHSA